MRKNLLKALTIALLMVCSAPSFAYYEHFSLLGMGTSDWNASSTARPINVNLNNTTYNEYFRVLYLTAGDYYFALTNSLNQSGDPGQYGPANNNEVMTVGAAGVFGGYNGANAWKVTIVEEGYYRIIVNEAAGNDENKEWYPTVRIEKNDLKLHAGFYGWDNREMKRVGDTYTYLCENLPTGTKEFVIRGGSNYQYYYTTTGVSVEGSELTLSKTSNEYPNFNFTVTEADDYVISVQITSENTVKVNVNKHVFEPSEYTEYNMSPADKVADVHGTCAPLFTWVTDNNGDVIITISAGEGTPGATKFRGANGMAAGGFKLNKSAEDFATYFSAAKVDDYTYKLTKQQDLPEGNNFISFRGQIECKSDIHIDDWSTYVFEKYTYGTVPEPVNDTQAPTNFTASVKSVSYTSVVLSLFANDDHASLIQYTITDQNENVYHTSGVPGVEIDYTITGLALNTQYTFSVVAKDQAENVTAPITNLIGTTLNGPDAKTSYFVLTGTKETMPGVGNTPATYEFYLSITRNSDFTLSSDVFVAGDLANATGLGNGSIGYRGNNDWKDYSNNGDGTRTRQTSQYDYATYEGQDIECFLHFAYENGLCQPYFHYVVGSETNNTYELNGQLVGEWYTICLPFNATIEGATLYSIESVAGSTINLTNAGTTAAAGKAYLYQPTATTVTATYTAVAAHTADSYLVGNLSATPVALNAASNAYILGSDNNFHKLTETATATVGQYKAYLTVPAAAPARLDLVINGNPVATGIENAAAVKATKALVDGKIVIVRNGAMFNLNGMLVK